MNGVNASARVLAGALVLGLALVVGGGPAIQRAAAHPAGQAAPTEQTAPAKADQEQQALGRLAQCGLEGERAQALWDAADGERRRELLVITQAPGWLDYLQFDFSWLERLERYEAYHAQHPEITAEEAVVRVNIGLDLPPYADPEVVEDPDSLTALVNQYHALPADYVPELVELDAVYTNQRDTLRPVAYAAFADMVRGAAREGLRLYNVSAYRSYAAQQWVYQRWANQDGAEEADTYSARPGCSEHQTGLVLDINVASTDAHFEETAEYAWLKENCWRYGFLLRFPEGKEEITGYRFEPWHYRYVGVETARLCWERGWTLEEYAARQSAPPWGRGT